MILNMKDLRNRLELSILVADRVFLIGHHSPDFDAIGACIGLHELVNHYGKDAFIIVDDDPLRIEPGVKKIIDENYEKYHMISKKKSFSLIDSNSLLIVVDANKDYMISVGDSLNKFEKIFVIDHHEEGEGTILTEDSYISLEASSACEIVTRILNGHRMSVKELENQKELINKLIDYENYKESEYLSKQGRNLPLYIIGLATLTIACRYENKMSEVLFGMLLAVSIIANITYVVLLIKTIVRHEEVKKKIKNK